MFSELRVSFILGSFILELRSGLLLIIVAHTGCLLAELVSSLCTTSLLSLDSECVFLFSCALVWFGFFLEEQHYLSVLCVWS